MARHCPGCKQYGEVEALEKIDLLCPHCQIKWGREEDLNKIFDFCPVCQNRQFYTSKDFNQALGCAIMLVGIVFVPWTYGLSLPVFALIDWSLHRKVPTLVNCYKCATEFRGFENTKNFKPFLHHIGLKYDKYR